MQSGVFIVTFTRRNKFLDPCFFNHVRNDLKMHKNLLLESPSAPESNVKN